MYTALVEFVCTMICETKFMEKEVQGSVALAIFLQGKERHNVLKRQHMDKCSKDGSGGMV